MQLLLLLKWLLHYCRLLLLLLLLEWLLLKLLLLVRLSTNSILIHKLESYRLNIIANILTIAIIVVDILRAIVIVSK